MSDETIEVEAEEFDPSELTTDGDPKPATEEPDGEVEASGDEDGEEAEERPAPKPKAKPEPAKTYKVKASGREAEVPAEIVDAFAKAVGLAPEDLLRGSQMAKAGQERLRAAAEAEKKAKALEERLKKDPRSAIADALGGRDAFLKLAIEEVAKLAEEEELAKTNPVELERRKLAAERAAVEAEKKAAEDAKKSEEAKAFEARFAQKLDGEMKAALEAGKLPRDPYVIKRLASAMADHLDATGDDPDDLTTADLVPTVLEEIQAEHSAFLGKLSGEQIVEQFPELAEKVRKALVSRVEGRGKPPPRTASGEERAPKAKTNERPRYYSTSAALSAWASGRR